MAGPKRSIPNSIPNSVQKMLEAAEQQDRRRQLQIANQTASIDRLLAALNDNDHEAHANEIEALNRALAETMLELEKARSENTRTVIIESLSDLQMELEKQVLESETSQCSACLDTIRFIDGKWQHSYPRTHAATPKLPEATVLGGTEND